MPEGIQQNGLNYRVGGDVNSGIAAANDFMLFRVVVNNGSTGLKGNYKIGFVDNSFCASIDVAEVIAFENKLDDLGRQKLEGYLARKWGLVDKLDPNHPYRSEPPVITLIGEDDLRLSLGTDYTEAGATATDVEDGEITDINITYEKVNMPSSPLAADTYSGLQLWLKADTGVTADTWADQSGNERDATAHGSPVLIENGLSGLPVCDIEVPTTTIIHSLSCATFARYFGL